MIDYIDYITTVGSSTVIAGLLTWLGKVWSTRIASRETAIIQKELEELKDQFTRKQQVRDVLIPKEISLYEKLSEIITDFRFQLKNSLILATKEGSSKELCQEVDQQNKLTLDSINNYIYFVNLNKGFLDQNIVEQAFLVMALLRKLGHKNDDVNEDFYRKLDQESEKLYTMMHDRMHEM